MSDSPEPEPKRYRVYSPSSPPHPHHQRSPTASTQLSPQSRPVSQPSLPVSQLVESIGDNRREISPAPSQRKNTDSNSNASAAEPLAYPRPSLPKGLSAVHSLDTGGTTARGPNTFKHAYSYPPSSSRSPAQHEHGHAAGPSRPSYDSYEPRRNPYEPTAYSGRYDDGYARRNPAHPTPPDSAGLRRPPPSPLSLARPSSSHQEFPSLSPLDVASTRQPNHPWPHGERRGSYTGGSNAEVASASRQYIRSPVSVSPRENGDFPRPSQTPTWDIANRSRPHSQHGYSASNRLSNNRYDPVASPLYARQPLHNAGPFPDYPRDYARQGRPDVNRVDIPRAQEHVAPTIPTPKTLKRRRASFSTLLPFSQSGVGGSSRSFPGEWTPEKREIFMDRIITAGYKALDLGALATEVSLIAAPLTCSLSSRKSN